MINAAGRFKGLVMLTMLLLIATRLTWLQTSDIKLDISATFYRTGLWFNQYARSSCPIAPESTFPLPAEMAVRSDATPPPPTSGQLSPGLASIMIARCHFVRLDVDDFSRWNPWTFMATALFSALFTRLIASSWTAGLLAAVAVLSRGTVQGRATLAAAEPFAMALVCGASCFGALFLRSLWTGWFVVAVGMWCASVLFVPSLWISLVLWNLLIACCLFQSTRYRGERNWEIKPLSSLPLPDTSSARSTKFWCCALGLSATASFAVLCIIHTWMPNSLEDIHMLARSTLRGHIFKEWYASLPLSLDQAKLYIHDVDLHALAALVFLMAHPSSRGRLGKTSRAAALAFFTVIIVQIFGSLFIEGIGAVTMSGLPAHVIPSARSLEPLLIAWGTASFWRILDSITGYRLSSSGWSIRGHATING